MRLCFFLCIFSLLFSFTALGEEQEEEEGGFNTSGAIGLTTATEYPFLEEVLHRSRASRLMLHFKKGGELSLSGSFTGIHYHDKESSPLPVPAFLSGEVRWSKWSDLSIEFGDHLHFTGAGPEKGLAMESNVVYLQASRNVGFLTLRISAIYLTRSTPLFGVKMKMSKDNLWGTC